MNVEINNYKIMNNNSSDSKSNSNESTAALISANKEVFYLSHEVNIIGRSENAFICIKDPLISRKQCVIRKQNDNKYTICDMSASGTFVNKKRLKKGEVQELVHRDKISFGIDDKYSYLFMINKKLKTYSEETVFLNSQMQEKIVNLDNSYSFEIQKLHIELNKIKSEKNELNKDMNSRLEAQESLNAEIVKLSNLVSLSKEQKVKAEMKINKMKNKLEAEKKNMFVEVDSKLTEMAKKEKELQQLMNEMELQHEKDKKDLEERCLAEIEFLKSRLAMSEMERDRSQEETKDAKQQLAESKQILMDCEIEQTRLVQEKDQVETKLADLTKEKDDLIRELQRKLKEKEEEEERVHKEIEKLEDDLMCSICSEIYIYPTVLDCGHMFCKACIQTWRKKKTNGKLCPMCRNVIKTCLQIYNLDSLIEKNVALLPAEAREHRQKIIKERTKEPTKPKKKKSNRQDIPINPFQQIARQIPMVQLPPIPLINEGANFFSFQHPLGAPRVEQVDLVDPFGWNNQEDRRRHIEADPVITVAEIDLTNVPVRRPTATVTSTTTGEPIDLTTP